MTEKNYVVNAKTPKGTIVTVRGDSAEELDHNIDQYIDRGISAKIAMFEQDVVSGGSAVTQVAQAFNATIVNETPIQQQQSFAPVPPPVQQVAVSGSGTATRQCIHGVMTKREGTGQWGLYRAFYCPTEKGTPDQCKAIYLKKTDPEWNTF